MKKYKAIAFDLDDTLLDTTNLLVPMASRNACLAMIAEGLQCDVEICHQMRQDLSNQMSHPEIFEKIVKTFGCKNEKTAIAKAIQTFYSPEIPLRLPLMSGAEQNLQSLQGHYKLFLVTMGNFKTQQKKIQSLGISKYFKEAFIVDGLKGERKEMAFKKILQQENIRPDELLSIGNRLSSEIRDGKKCGAETCHFSYGEHEGETPQTSFDHPDFTITEHKELIKTCAL